MSKFYHKFILLLIAAVGIGKSYCQTCLICPGGSSDGYANEVLSSCSPQTTIFTGGIYTGFASDVNGTCTSASIPFTGGGSFSGFSGAADGACAAGATIVSGGGYDGFSGNTVSVCDPPVSLMVGGDYDGTNAAFDYCVPLAVVNQVNQFAVNLYPNPASDEVSISLTASSPASGRIIINDVLGKEMMSQYIEPSTHLYSFTTRHWAEGVYVVTVVSDEVSYKQLLVIKSNH